MTDEQPTVGFVCVGNAGRSQMATAFAAEERERRTLELRIVTGGTNPANHVHEPVIEAMADRGIDVSDRVPRRITDADVRDCTHVVTMGCDAAEVFPDDWDGEHRDWDLPNPHGEGVEATATLRDEIERRVGSLFDELEASYLSRSV